LWGRPGGGCTGAAAGWVVGGLSVGSREGAYVYPACSGRDPCHELYYYYYYYYYYDHYCCYYYYYCYDYEKLLGDLMREKRMSAL